MVAPSARSSPVRVGDVLFAALPELRVHMVQDGIRRDWSSIVGPEVSRRSQPSGLRHGVLDVTVDNSPWLHELTLRSGELLAALQTRYGAAVTSLKLALGPAATASSPATPRRRRPERPLALGPADADLVESAVAPVVDPALAASIRRVITKDLLARQASGPGRPTAPPLSERGNA